MRLLMTTDPIGGVWTFTSELAAELLSRGYAIALVSFGRALSAEQRKWVNNLTIRFPQFQYTACHVPLEWMQENASAYTASEFLLLKLCDRYKPDALLLSQFCHGALPVDLPKIVIAHSDVLSWAAAVGKAPLANDAWLRTYCSLVQRGLDGADAVIAPTHAMLNDLQAHFRAPALAQVIPNGRTLTAQNSASPRTLRAVTAGRMWDEAKNLKLLCGCSSPMPIVVAGEHTGSQLDSGSLTMLGLQSETELLKLFQNSAIYICTSIYEPFGLAPLEAAMCGCAVLANDISSLREVWGDAALYFHDAASLSACLSLLANSPKILASAQARSHARARTYSSARMAEQYIHRLKTTKADSDLTWHVPLRRAQESLPGQLTSETHAA